MHLPTSTFRMDHFVRIATAIGLTLSACWLMQASSPATAKAQVSRVDTVELPTGELIYIPIYSSIFYENGKSTLDLAATLNIHNVNPDREIKITRADYYNTSGRLIQKYAEKPIVLRALQTKSIVIDKSDSTGGTGANFLVEWQSDQPVTSPLVEAVMVNASSNLGIAFTSTGKVVREASTRAK